MTRAGQAKGLGLLTLIDTAAVAASLLSATQLAGRAGPLTALYVAGLTFCAAVAAVVPAVGWILWARGGRVGWPFQLVPLLLAVGGQVLAAQAAIAA